MSDNEYRQHALQRAVWLVEVSLLAEQVIEDERLRAQIVQANEQIDFEQEEQCNTNSQR